MKKIICAGLLLVLVACTSPEPEADTDGTWVGTITTEGNVTIVGTERAQGPRRIGASPFGDLDTLGFPTDIAVQGGVVAVLDRSPLVGTEQLLLFERSSGEITGRFGPKGQGPGDLNGPQSLYFTQNGSGQLWINDHRNGRVVLYDAEDPSAGPAEIWRTDGSSLFQAHWVQGRLFGNGNFVTEILRVYRREGSSLALTHEYGDPLFLDIAPAVASSLHRNAMAVRPSEDAVVLAFLWLSRLQIYDAQGQLIRSVAGPREVIPAYDRQEQRRFVLDREEGRAAYLDVEATQDYIFALFGGIRGLVTHGQEVHVFSWSGELVEILELEEAVTDFALDPESGELLGFRWEPDPVAFAFESIWPNQR